MTPFNPQRRDLLRVGSLGVAGAAIPAVSFAAQTGAPSTAPAPTIFSVRQYGAAGDGKTLDTDASIAPLTPPQPPAEVSSSSRRAPISASPSA